MEIYRQFPVRLLVRPGQSLGGMDAIQFGIDQTPGLDWYGVMPDDSEPMTQGWDIALSKTAMQGYIAFCDTGFERKFLMPVMGGEELRKVGYFAPPGMHHYGGDRFWRLLGEGTGRLAYLPDHMIRLPERLVGDGKNWDDVTLRQKARQHEDKAVFLAFRQSGGLQKLVDKIGRLPLEASA